LQNLHHRRWAIVRVLFETPLHQTNHPAVEIGSQRRQRWRRVHDLLHQHPDRSIRFERKTPAQEPEHQNPECIHVHPGIGGLAPRLLGSHVAGRSENGTALRERAARAVSPGELGKTEVADLGDAILAACRVSGGPNQHDVPRLQIPVNDAELVRLRQNPGNLKQDGFRLGSLEFPFIHQQVM
jgi:hypothetical protein